MQPVPSQAPQVICLGEALVDRFEVPTNDPAVNQIADDWLGGAPANVACGLARLGTTAAFIGCLGRDKVAAKFCALFAERGVNLEALQHDATRPSRIVLVRRYADGERAFQGFVDDHGTGFSDQALSLSTLRPFWPNLSVTARWLLIGTVPLAAPQAAETLRWCVEQANIACLPIALDVNWRPIFWNLGCNPNSAPDATALIRVEPLLKVATLLKLTREEALWFCGTCDPVAISSSLPQQPDVVVTAGAEPVCWSIGTHQGTTAILKPRCVVDTTGAGDAFMAGLLHQLTVLTTSQREVSSLNRGQVENAIHYAIACGALVCGGAGAIDPQPSQSQVGRFLEVSGMVS